MYAYAHRPHRLVYENVIGSQYRKSRWERANGWRRLHEFAHIAQMAIKCIAATAQLGPACGKVFMNELTGSHDDVRPTDRSKFALALESKGVK